MKKILFLFFVFPIFLFSQDLDIQIEQINQQLAELERQKIELQKNMEALKLSRVQRDLQAVGLPSDNYIMHSAMALEYAEEFEQARWVAHIIVPDVIHGAVSRTNDFREDPKVNTGTAVEADYFLKSLKANGTFEYDGFGYDRGHLAPSADFRWSRRALSESYYYSNMSPQIPEFNREAWAELESLLRGYIYQNPETQLYVVTGGILEEGLPAIERSVNKVRIPKHFFKVALDLKNKTGIAFLMPNQMIQSTLETFALSIDEIEQLSGLDFFPNLPDAEEAALESAFELERWMPEMMGGDVEPVYPPSLKPGYFNTVQAKIHQGNGKKVNICGTVVSTRYSRSGNLWVNVDKQYPNQIFSAYIRKKDLPNFSYQPEQEWINQKVCFSGQVKNMNGTPTINLEKEEQIRMGLPLR